MLDLFGARVEEIRDCIVASVVPPVFNSVRNGIVKLTGKEAMVVGPGIKTGINILLEDPGATGADLIAAAVAAVDAYPTPLTVVDMGTATTIAVIDDGNAFLGGAVLPRPAHLRRGPVQPGLPPVGHPAGTAPAGHWEVHCGVHAERPDVRRRGHGGRPY